MNTLYRIENTNSDNPDFRKLVSLLDKSLWETYPELKADYWGNNIIEFNPNVVLVFRNDVAVACACFKKYDANSVEIKRMFVSPEHRGFGLAQHMLQELEKNAAALGFTSLILETLVKQTAAIALYKSAGFVVIENYPPYEGRDLSVCMRKTI